MSEHAAEARGQTHFKTAALCWQRAKHSSSSMCRLTVPNQRTSAALASFVTTCAVPVCTTYNLRSQSPGVFLLNCRVWRVDSGWVESVCSGRMI